MRNLIGALVAILAFSAVHMLAGCAPPATVSALEPAPVVTSSVKVRPDPILRTQLAWYYCDVDEIDPAYIMISRAPIIDGRVGRQWR